MRAFVAYLKDGVHHRLSSRALSYFPHFPSSQIAHAFLSAMGELGMDVDSVKGGVAFSTFLYFRRNDPPIEGLHIPFAKDAVAYAVGRRFKGEDRWVYLKHRKRLGVVSYPSLKDLWHVEEGGLEEWIKAAVVERRPQVEANVLAKKSRTHADGVGGELYNEQNLFIKASPAFKVGVMAHIPSLSRRQVEKVFAHLSLAGLGADRSTGGGVVWDRVEEVDLPEGRGLSIALGLFLYDPETFRPAYGRAAVYDVVSREGNTLNATYTVVREGALVHTSGVVGRNVEISDGHVFVGKTLALPLGWENG